jgi:BolA family transcriptional regulator, general stress-responsive regulator
VICGLTAAAFLISTVFGRQTLVQRMFQGAFTEPMDVSKRAWLTINVLWAGWFVILAVLNIVIARHLSENAWVNFKIFGIVPATVLFMIPQVLWLSGKIKPEANPEVPDDGPADAPPGAAAAAGTDRTQQLRQRLESSFSPSHLTIEDESHLHAGHAGAASGHAHFRIRIVAEAFRGIPTVTRHRLVYAAVGDLMRTDIHALAIEALPPE